MTATDDQLVLEHSAEADVSAEFAWKQRTDIATWNDPPATFRLDGPFADGARGATLIPGDAPLIWWIRDVQPGLSFAIEMPLERAMLRSDWCFTAISATRTKITQRITLSGTNAAAYRDQVERGFGSTLADGMAKIAADLVAAERSRETGSKARQV
jgi:hypothetical protein